MGPVTEENPGGRVVARKSDSSSAVFEYDNLTEIEREVQQHLYSEVEALVSSGELADVFDAPLT